MVIGFAPTLIRLGIAIAGRAVAPGGGLGISSRGGWRVGRYATGRGIRKVSQGGTLVGIGAKLLTMDDESLSGQLLPVQEN